MTGFQYVLFFLATVVFTLGIYYFLQVFFVYRRLDKYFFFSMTTVGAVLYIAAQLVLTYPLEGDTLLFWHRLKLAGMLVVVPAWFYCIYAILEWRYLLPNILFVFALVCGIFLPTGLYVSLPLSRLEFKVLGLPLVYQFGTTGIAYTAFAAGFITLFVYTIFRIILAVLPRRTKMIGLGFAMLPLLAGLNDFAVTHRLFENFMIAEFAFFIFLIATFVLFVQEQHRAMEDLRTARKTLIEQERNKKELEIAAHIQTSILPVIPPIPDYDVSVCMIPADAAGGDYYDYERTADGRHWFCIGDVSGHGLTPGLVMLMAQSAFRTALSLDPGASPGKIVSHVNRTLYSNIHDRLRDGFYMTCSVYTADDKGIFSIAGAHLDTLIYRARGRFVEHLPVEGMWLGVVPDIDPETSVRSFRLDPGDALVLYTDGVTEARNAAHEQYGVERFEAQIIAHGDMLADELRLHLLEDVYRFMAGQSDDITLYIVKPRFAV